jgi:hypothetical protein
MLALVRVFYYSVGPKMAGSQSLLGERARVKLSLDSIHDAAVAS